MKTNILELPNKEEWIQKQIRPYKRAKSNSVKDIEAARVLVAKKRIQFSEQFDKMTESAKSSAYNDKALIKRIKALEDLPFDLLAQHIAELQNANKILVKRLDNIEKV